MLLQVRNEVRMSLSCTPSSDVLNIEIVLYCIANELKKFSLLHDMKKGEDREGERKKNQDLLDSSCCSSYWRHISRNIWYQSSSLTLQSVASRSYGSILQIQIYSILQYFKF